MKRTFLTDDARILEILREARLPVFKLTSENMPDLRDGEVIVIGKPGEAKAGALTLASRGVSEFRLSYAEAEAGKSVLDLVKAPKHLFWDDARSLLDVKDEADFPVYESGYPFLDPNLKWRIPELCVAGGPYGSGKSIFIQALAARFIAMYGDLMNTSALLCSWEDMPSELKRAQKNHADGLGLVPEDFLRRMHYVARDPDDSRLIAWYDNLVRYYHARFNTKFFVLDPWNEFDHVKQFHQSETEYVGEMMKAFRRLVNKLQIILIIVTHVSAKYIKQDGSIEPFRIAHAFGSGNFANKMDRGICIARTKSFGGDHTVVRFDKCKVERLMGRKGTVGMTYDDASFSFRFDAHATECVRDLWKN